MGETYPSEDLALVATHHSPDVILHHRNQGVLVPDLGDPAGELRVPDKGVTTDELVVAGSPVDKAVGVAELEVTARWLGGIPLHAVYCIRSSIERHTRDDQIHLFSGVIWPKCCLAMLERCWLLRVPGSPAVPQYLNGH